MVGSLFGFGRNEWFWSRTRLWIRCRIYCGSRGGLLLSSSMEHSAGICDVGYVFFGLKGRLILIVTRGLEVEMGCLDGSFRDVMLMNVKIENAGSEGSWMEDR